MSKRKYLATESKYMSAAEFAVGQKFVVPIRDIIPEIVGLDQEEKDVVHFGPCADGTQLKPYPLNVRNTKRLVQLFGKDPEAPRGQTITVEIGLTEFGNKDVNGVFFTAAPASAPAQQPAPQPAPEAPAAPAAATAPKRGRGRPPTKPATAAVPADGAADKGLDDEIPW
jgi:hypothetical protein